MSINKKVSILSNTLREKNSLFYTCWRINLINDEVEDFVKFASKARRERDKFKLVELSSDIYMSNFC